MTRVVCAALLAFSVASCSQALAREDASISRAPGPAVEQTLAAVRPALFVVRDADSTIYLFGTMHIRRPGSEWGGPIAQAALAEADEVWTEMEISPEADADVRALVRRHGMAPSRRPLSSWLSENERAELAAAIAKVSVPPDAVERMQPWLAAMTLLTMPLVQAGYDPGASVDLAVVNAAGDARVRTFAAPAHQIGLFTDLSERGQREYLLYAIRVATEGVEEMDAMSVAWERGDLNTLEAMVRTDFRAHCPELSEVMFTQRNRRWVEELVTELEGGGCRFCCSWVRLYAGRGWLG